MWQFFSPSAQAPVVPLYCSMKLMSSRLSAGKSCACLGARWKFFSEISFLLRLLSRLEKLKTFSASPSCANDVLLECYLWRFFLFARFFSQDAHTLPVYSSPRRDLNLNFHNSHASSEAFLEAEMWKNSEANELSRLCGFSVLSSSQVREYARCSVWVGICECWEKVSSASMTTRVHRSMIDLPCWMLIWWHLDEAQQPAPAYGRSRHFHIAKLTHKTLRATCENT